MDEERVLQDFYYDLGTSELNQLYIDKAREEGYCEETIELGVIIPSRNKDYKKRFGLKGKPFTKEFEITQTISVLHASKLYAFKCREFGMSSFSGMPQVVSWSDRERDDNSAPQA